MKVFFVIFLLAICFLLKSFFFLSSVIRYLFVEQYTSHNKFLSHSKHRSFHYVLALAVALTIGLLASLWLSLVVRFQWIGVFNKWPSKMANRQANDHSILTFSLGVELMAVYNVGMAQKMKWLNMFRSFLIGQKIIFISFNFSFSSWMHGVTLKLSQFVSFVQLFRWAI